MTERQNFLNLLGFIIAASNLLFFLSIDCRIKQNRRIKLRIRNATIAKDHHRAQKVRKTRARRPDLETGHDVIRNVSGGVFGGRGTGIDCQ